MNSLGLEIEPAKMRVVVAMSGGVDSSVTAAMLKDEGYDVVGITLQLYDYGMAVQKKGACCAGQDIYDAKQVADKINIPHYVLDYESRFKETVIDEFADAYLRGETPIPCVRCNQNVKFKDLLATARDLGAEALATGHYVRRVMGAAGAELHAATNTLKDQSYFLFTTTQEQLDFLRFPLGGMEKAETRALAEKYGLPVAEKPDSQDICFVPNGDYASVVSKLRPGAIDPGEIVDREGHVLGRHEGIINFTIGQRRGLNISDRIGDNNDPYYVIALDAAKKQVIVGPHSALAKQRVRLTDMNWLSPLPSPEKMFDVRLRSSQTPLKARVMEAAGKSAMLELLEPAFGVAPGQAGVLYDGTRVMGGGWIT
jgi:tRNA-uridine 2-sulfurtransferase